ncbi:hypothetical protein NX059_005390 [Plenodomus lindquistii]|nr:hypothetical protein NX059_005390 [Plenodomus lindquistii]
MRVPAVILEGKLPDWFKHSFEVKRKRLRAGAHNARLHQISLRQQQLEWPVSRLPPQCRCHTQCNAWDIEMFENRARWFAYMGLPADAIVERDTIPRMPQSEFPGYLQDDSYCTEGESRRDMFTRTGRWRDSPSSM